MTQEVEQFFTTQQAFKTIYTCVEIRNDAASILFRLVKGNFGSKQFIVDGVLRDFTGSGFEVPEQEILAGDETEKGSLRFGRIGYQVATEIRKLDNVVSLSPLTIRVLQYLDIGGQPQSDYTVYSSDIKMTMRDVEITLTTENFEKQTRADKIVTTDKYPGVGL